MIDEEIIGLCVSNGERKEVISQNFQIFHYERESHK